MKVLYFHQHFSTPHGSAGLRSYEMARALVNRGHDVIMVCGGNVRCHTGLSDNFKNGYREGNVNGIWVIELQLPYSNNDGFFKRSLTFLKFAWKGIKIALTKDYDLLFATSTPLTIGIPGIIARLIKRKKFIFEVRDLWPELPREMGVITNPIILLAMSVLEWCSYHCANACIGLSPGIVKGIERLGVSSDKVTMIPNGCDLDLFHPNKINSTKIIGSENCFRAIFTGAHGEANGLDAVLDVAALLKKRGRNDICLIFIGDGKLKGSLRSRAEREKLNNCLFLDPVPKRELDGIIQYCDVTMMILDNVPAFYFGTSPNKFFDYIASGKPVLNNYPGWLANLIIENNCGLAVPPDAPDLFADALELLERDRGRLVSMGVNSRKLAVDQFDRKDLAKNFCAWLEKWA